MQIKSTRTSCFTLNRLASSANTKVVDQLDLSHTVDENVNWYIDSREQFDHT